MTSFAWGESASSSTPGPALASASTGEALAGKWTYRSFHNDPVPVTDDTKTAAEKALTDASTLDMSTTTTAEDLRTRVLRLGSFGVGPAVPAR